MKSYLGLVSEYARIHKKKSRLTVVCIVLSVMLITTVFSMADMSIQAQINENIRQKGNWHAIVTDISDKIAKQIDSRSDVSVSGWVGMAEDSVFSDKSLIIQGGDANIAYAMGLHIAEGDYPSSDCEAVLDQTAMEQFDLLIGDTMEVPIGGSMLQYTITGVYNDFSSLKSSDAHGLFLSTEGIRALPGVFQEYFYIQFDNGVNINRAIKELQTEYSLSDDQVSVNLMLLGLMGQSDDSSMKQLYLTAAILAFFVSMAGIFMIASSFNMSIMERTQFFGLMRCLGATKKQVKRYIFVEGLRYSMIGIPIGLVSGCLVTWVAVLFLNTLDSQYLPNMSLEISWIALLTGATIGVLTVMLASHSPAKKASRVSPQAAVSGNVAETNNNYVWKAANTKLVRVDTAMGVSHAFSNKKSMLLITGSFAMSIILLLCFSVFITFMNNAVRPLQSYTSDISVVGSDTSTLINRSLVKQLKALSGADKVYARMFYHNIPASAPQGSGKVTLISYDELQFKWGEEKLVSGSLDSVKQGEEVLIAYSENMNWQVGNTIDLDISSTKANVVVAGILSNTPFVTDDDEWLVICSEETFTKLTGMYDYTIVDMQVDENISTEVRELLPPELRLLDNQQSNREVQATYNAMAVFVYGFLIVIALVALINILNTVSASVSSRMNNYGVMRAVGMSSMQLKKVIRAEATVYALTGSVVGAVLGMVLQHFFFELLITANWGQQWQPPIAVLVAIITAVIFTTSVAVISPAKKIERMSVVGVVNDQ